MNEQFFKDLGKTASKQFLTDATPLNDSVTKLAKQHKLNPEQIARVCEAANLNTYTSKMASTKDRLSEFNLADKSKVIADLNLSEAPKPVKQADDKSINYFIKNASMRDESSVFAPEYGSDGRFLKDLTTPDLSKVSITKTASEISNARTAHTHGLKNMGIAKSKMAMQQKLKDLDAEQLVTQIKLTSAFEKAVDLIKQAAVSTNPFIIWRDYDKSADSALIDKIFIKAAEELIKFNEKRAQEVLSEAKRFSPPEHDAYITERKVKVINHDPIIHQIDNVTNFRKILDKIEAFKSNDGLFEKSVTPQPTVEHSIDNGQSAKDWHDKLTGRS